MITTTHVVTNMLLARRSKRHGKPGVVAAEPKWFAVGGVAPDVGLTLLTAGAAIWLPRSRDMSLQEAMEYAFNTLFFEDRVWIAVSNTLQSPVVLVVILVIAKLTASPRLMAFAAGCLLHATMDVAVHHDDGPLLFFPFDWNYRFESPLSYYDRDHYGAIVAPIDMAITVIGGGFLARQWWKHRRFW